MTADTSRKRGLWIFAAACALAVAAVVLYAALTSPRPGAAPAAASISSRNGFIDAVPSGPLILFRDGSPGDLYGRLAVVRLPIGDQPRQTAPLSCERVHYAAGWGVCLVTDESQMPVRYS